MSARGEARMAEIRAEQAREKREGFYRNEPWLMKLCIALCFGAMSAVAGAVLAYFLMMLWS